MQTGKTFLLKTLLILIVIESSLALYFTSVIPSDAKNAIWLGFSSARLVLMGGAVLMTLAAAFSLAGVLFSQQGVQRAEEIVDGLLGSERNRSILAWVAWLVFGGCVLFVLTPPEEFGTAFYRRLLPIVVLFMMLALNALIFQFMWLKWTINLSLLVQWRTEFRVAGITLGLFALLWAFAVRTGIGVIPEPTGWHFPGTPLLFSQLILAWLAALIFILWGGAIKARVTEIFSNQKMNLRLDVWICFVLWLAALLVWWAEPVRRESYFTPEPTPPNYEYYPHSDAAIYDTSAQNMLIGADQNNKIVLRPLYVFFLTFLHTVAGQQYEDVILSQIIFFAVIPVLGYVLASLLGGRAAGLMTAILLLLREKNSIALTNVIEVSHSKLLLSDVPAMLFMLLTVYILLLWLRRESAMNYLGVLAGASFGMLVLTRSHQSLFIIPAILLGMMFSGGFQVKRTLQRILIFALSFAVVVTPWMLRNNVVNGKPAIESSEFYISWYAGAFTEPTDTVDILPGESQDEYSNRIKRQVFRYILNHPLELAQISASYYVRNEIASVLALPMSPVLYDLRSYVSRMNFWSDPQITFSFGSGLFFFVTVGLIAFGASMAVRRLGFAGIVPLLIHFTYNSSMSLARISGWRFVQPVDWILILYYCMGLVGLTVVVISLILKTNVTVHTKLRDARPLPSGGGHWVALALFLLFGLSLPLTEILSTEQYPAIEESQLVSRYGVNDFVAEDGERVTASDVENFLETEPTSVVLYGRALYPSFYESGKRWGDDSYPQFVRDIPRLQFRIIGPEQRLVYMPLEIPPSYFPNTSNVFVIGCDVGRAVRAILVEVNGQVIFSAASGAGLTCSAP
jgi:4-amino-4-deoxy-L-arabinose transferase-like glycosyltransferase